MIGSHDWTAILIGYDSGHFRIFTEVIYNANPEITFHYNHFNK